MVSRDVNDCDRRLGRQILRWWAPFQLTMTAETAGLLFTIFFAAACKRLQQSWTIWPARIRCSFSNGKELLRALGRDYLLQNSIQTARHLPIRIMRLEFPNIGNVADVIALARFLHIMPVQFAPG